MRWRNLPGWARALLVAVGILVPVAPGGYAFFGQPSVVVSGSYPVATTTRPAPTPSATPPGAASVCLKYGAVSDPYALMPSPPKSGPEAAGPPVSPVGGVKAVDHELRLRLCGRPTHGPDERLWAMIRAAVPDGFRPNMHVSNRRWVDGVNRMVGSEIHWGQTRLVRPTFCSQAQSVLMTRAAFPLIEVTPGTTNCAPDVFLRVPITVGAHTVVLYLRLRCGFQPYWASIQLVPRAIRAGP